MTEHNPPERETFLADQQEAATEAERNAAEYQARQDTMWEHQMADAVTTIEQRTAVTRLVRAKASLLETVDVFAWLAIAMAVIAGGWYGVAAIVGALR